MKTKISEPAEILSLLVDINNKEMSIKDIVNKNQVYAFVIRDIAKEYANCITNTREYKDMRKSDELDQYKQYEIYREYMKLVESNTTYAVGKISSKYKIGYVKIYKIIFHFKKELEKYNKINQEFLDRRKRIAMNEPTEEDIIITFKHPVKDCTNCNTAHILEECQKDPNFWRRVYCVVSLNQKYNQYQFVKKHMLKRLLEIYFSKWTEAINIKKLDMWIYANLEAEKDKNIKFEY